MGGFPACLSAGSGSCRRLPRAMSCRGEGALRRAGNSPVRAPQQGRQAASRSPCCHHACGLSWLCQPARRECLCAGTSRTRREAAMASGRLGGRIKRDDTIAGVDDSEMPRLCETCLGPTAYLRMQRLPLTSECHVCARAMTSFRFQPGPQARYKKTVLCNVCSDHKNACQCCINDLTYSEPSAARPRDGPEAEAVPLAPRSRSH